ncbi:hypothetical protein [Shouchella patagoniensis]|uniref:hypothetical protein n=1 Tax=Shouchella patagoniensis TaxID=228576 RepID=UPI000994CC52|nr:hypothetical protein [Shouchella patagoniensis]
MKHGIAKLLSVIGSVTIGAGVLVGLIICFQDPYDYVLFSPVTLGVMTFVSSIISGALFLGLAEVIDLLEDIRSDAQKTGNILERMDNRQRES